MKKLYISIIISFSILNGGNNIIVVGEQLIYSASFNYVPAGTAELNIVGIENIMGSRAYHVRYQAKTKPVADRLFKIRDQIDTWIDVNELYTYRQIKDISEGKYSYKSDTWLNYADSIATNGSDTTKISGFVRDPYSLFYYLRSIELPIDSILTFTTFDRNKLTTFQMKVGKSESISVPAGKYNCIHIRPYNKDSNLFKNKGEMDLWFSQDDKRIPVQIIVKLKYGILTLKLQSVSY